MIFERTNHSSSDAKIHAVFLLLTYRDMSVCLRRGKCNSLKDPEIRTWFLVQQKTLPFILTGFYILFTTVIGPTLMKNRKPFELRNIMIIFNFSLVIIYFSCLFLILWNVTSITFQQMCYEIGVVKGDVTYKLATYCWIIYLVKYVEYLDTVFFVLRKKQNQVTFLHVIHHSLVPICIWLVCRTERSGIMAIPGFINAFVHIIMYSYYGLAAFGPQVRKYLWWKKYLTQIQMIQFLVIITFALVVVPLSGCNIIITSYIIQIVCAPLFLYLFYVYYRRSFQPKGLTKLTNGEDKRKDKWNHEIEKKKLT